MFTDIDTVTPATIADVSLNVTDGVHNTVHDDPEGQYLLLSCKNIKGSTLNIGPSERRISAETFEKLRRRTKLSKGDVLISSVGTVGELLLLNTEPSFYEFQRSVAIIKPNPKIVSSAYLYEALMSQKNELINAAHGAVQQCLFISDIAGFPIGIPLTEDLNRFDEIVTPLFDAISANEAANTRLAALRDTLLPKLMSGEIDVSNITL
ncbi:MAG: restriction endonuclease subunit S [Prevotella sp.]|nr:restriction endonuclease subunit S [Prevotella sp.]